MDARTGEKAKRMENSRVGANRPNLDRFANGRFSLIGEIGEISDPPPAKIAG
jgi:hypothetical protein